MVGKRERESPEIGAMALRVLRALVKRAGEGDTEALEQLARIERELPGLISEAGRAMHGWGYSYTELGAVLGITRQAARQRFNDRTNRPLCPACGWPDYGPPCAKCGWAA